MVFINKKNVFNFIQYGNIFIIILYFNTSFSLSPSSNLNKARWNFTPLFQTPKTFTQHLSNPMVKKTKIQPDKVKTIQSRINKKGQQIRVASPTIQRQFSWTKTLVTSATVLGALYRYRNPISTVHFVHSFLRKKMITPTVARPYQPTLLMQNEQRTLTRSIPFLSVSSWGRRCFQARYFSSTPFSSKERIPSSDKLKLVQPRKKTTFLSLLTDVTQAIKSNFTSPTPPPRVTTHRKFTSEKTTLPDPLNTFFHGSTKMEEILESGYIRPNPGYVGKGVYLSSIISESAEYAHNIGGVFALGVFPSQRSESNKHSILNYFIYPDNIPLVPYLKAIFLYEHSAYLRELVEELHPKIPIYMIKNKFETNLLPASSPSPLCIFDKEGRICQYPPYMCKAVYPYQHMYWPVQNFSHLHLSLVLEPQTQLFTCRIQAATNLENVNKAALKEHLWSNTSDGTELHGNESGLIQLKVEKKDINLQKGVALTQKEVCLAQTAESILFFNETQKKEVSKLLPQTLKDKEKYLMTTFRGPKNLYNSFDHFSASVLGIDTRDCPIDILTRTLIQKTTEEVEFIIHENRELFLHVSMDKIKVISMDEAQRREELIGNYNTRLMFQNVKVVQGSSIVYYIIVSDRAKWYISTSQESVSEKEKKKNAYQVSLINELFQIEFKLQDQQTSCEGEVLKNPAIHLEHISWIKSLLWCFEKSGLAFNEIQKELSEFYQRVSIFEWEGSVSQLFLIENISIAQSLKNQQMNLSDFIHEDLTMSLERIQHQEESKSRYIKIVTQTQKYIKTSV